MKRYKPLFEAYSIKKQGSYDSVVGIKGWVKKNLFQPIAKPLQMELNTNAKKQPNANEMYAAKSVYEDVVYYIDQIIQEVEKRNRYIDARQEQLFSVLDTESFDNPEWIDLSLESITIPTDVKLEKRQGTMMKYTSSVIKTILMPIFEQYNANLSKPSTEKRKYELINKLKELYNQMEYWI